MAFRNPTDDFQPVMRRNYVVNAFRGNITYDDAFVLLQKPPWIYTSPNLAVIPYFEPNPKELRARDDGRFGLEDYACHPQGYSESFPWAPCIPRRPTSPADGQDHPHALLWRDLRDGDWVAPLGCAFTGVGTLELSLYTEMYVKAVQLNTHAVRMWMSQPVPPEIVSTARALFTTLERLKSLPLSFRDLALQWMQAQRLALDLIAMDTFYGVFLPRSLQRDKIWPVNLSIMGAFTTNPAVADNLYHAGIPIVYVRTDADPNAWNLRVWKIADDFWMPSDVTTAEWYCPSKRTEIPCRTIWLASHGTERIKMSRPFGRYFEDIASLPSAPSQQSGFTFPAPPPPATAQTPAYDNALPDIIYTRSPSPEAFAMNTEDSSLDDEIQRAPTPQCDVSVRPAARSNLVNTGGVHKLTRSQKKQQQVEFRQSQASGSSSPLRVYVPTATPKEQRAINRNKWEPFESEFLPPYSPQWVTALRSVDKYAKPRNFIPQEECGTMFPDPGYFAAMQTAKLQAATAAWLFIRPSRCGQMLHPFRGKMPTANATTWRKFFYIYSCRWADPTAAVVPPPKSTSRPHVVEHLNDAVQAAKELFGPELVANMHLEATQVQFHEHSIRVIEGCAQGLSLALLQHVTWELAELNWRYELLALDHIVSRDNWRGEDAASARLEMVLDVFKPNKEFVWWNSEIPTVNPGITAATIELRLPALLALRRLMVGWVECPLVIHSLRWTRPFDEDHEYALDYERIVLHNYCQTFYEHFGRPPITPMRLPPNYWKRG